MKYIVRGIQMPPGYSENALKEKIAKSIGVEPSLFSFYVIKRSIDARKNQVFFVISAVVETALWIKRRGVTPYDDPLPLEIPKSVLSSRPVIVGFGPAGMFAALILARAGAKPIVIERGKRVEERKLDVLRLKNEGVLDINSNVCYGEGGAGTFSDGKLHTGVTDVLTKFILEEFVKHGAKEEILTDGAPHIGSDYLQKIVKSFRKEIISLGGDILFGCELTGLIIKKGKIDGIRYLESGTEHSLETNRVILALGHSPYETMKRLVKDGLKVEPKDYSIGVRIEHSQKAINEGRYHAYANNPSLPPASYKSVAHLDSGRTLYSFCMCPGGEVVNSSTEKDAIVTNGMSNSDHAMSNGNSAILVPVKVADFYHGNPLDGFLFREEIEKKAFRADKPFYAPIQLVSDFLKNQKSESLKGVLPSYRPGTYFDELSKNLPSFISESIKEGLQKWRRYLPFMNEEGALLVGYETRSSSPIRIPRDSNFESNIIGLYPCGEGASYAGGITSAALDGVNLALSILKEN